MPAPGFLIHMANVSSAQCESRTKGSLANRNAVSTCCLLGISVFVCSLRFTHTQPSCSHGCLSQDRRALCAPCPPHSGTNCWTYVPATPGCYSALARATAPAASNQLPLGIKRRVTWNCCERYRKKQMRRKRRAAGNMMGARRSGARLIPACITGAEKNIAER